ncbi:MAG: alginate export family protein [Bacteroidetes bacterium]|nr:alginate export family protein [Bacteroidota bacterium]
MKNLSKLVFLAVIMLLPGTSSMAQFTVSGEFRPRAEYRDGYTKLRDSTQTAYGDILGRARIIFDYKNEKFTTRFSLQHAFVFGENNCFNSDTIRNNTVNIFEAWFKYNFLANFSVRVGRIAISYDDQRLIGYNNWRPQGSAHDMVGFQWGAEKAAYQGDFGFAINNTSPAGAFISNYNMKNYKYMSYLWNQKSFFRNMLKISVMGLIDAYQLPTQYQKVTSTQILWVINGQDTIGHTTLTTTSQVPITNPNQVYARFTLGGNVWFNWKNLSIWAGGYFQGGNIQDGREVVANMYGVNAAYQIVKPFRLMAGYEHLSGTDNNPANKAEVAKKVNSFNVLYGTNHQLYGYMDLFNSMLTTSPNYPGLNQIYARGTVNFSKVTSLEATWRYFSFGKEYLTDGTKVSRNLGSELDLMFLYKPLPNVELNAAYCYFFPTSAMELYNGLKSSVKGSQYVYLMITYKPKFFSTEKN